MSPTLDIDRHLQMVPDPLTASPAHDELRPKRALARAAGKPKSTFTPGPNLTMPGDGPVAGSPQPLLCSERDGPRGPAQRRHMPRASHLETIALK